MYPIPSITTMDSVQAGISSNFSLINSWIQIKILFISGQKNSDQHSGGDASANTTSGSSGSATSPGKKY